MAVETAMEMVAAWASAREVQVATEEALMAMGPSQRSSGSHRIPMRHNHTRTHLCRSIHCRCDSKRHSGRNDLRKHRRRCRTATSSPLRSWESTEAEQTATEGATEAEQATLMVAVKAAGTEVALTAAAMVVGMVVVTAVATVVATAATREMETVVATELETVVGTAEEKVEAWEVQKAVAMVVATAAVTAVRKMVVKAEARVVKTVGATELVKVVAREVAMAVEMGAKKAMATAVVMAAGNAAKTEEDAARGLEAAMVVGLADEAVAAEVA